MPFNLRILRTAYFHLKEATPELKESAALVLSLTSFVSSSLGFIAFISGDGISRGVLTYCIPLVLTAGIQILLLSSIREVKGARNLLGALKPLILTAALMTYSVSFSYIFYWDWLLAGRMAHTEIDQHTVKVGSYLVAFESQYGRLVESLQSIVAYQTATAKIELDDGGTCGDGSPDGDGPRTKLRLADAAQFKAYVEPFSRRRREATAALASFEAALAQADGNWTDIRRAARAAMQNAVKLRSDSLLATVRSDLAARLALGRGLIPKVAGIPEAGSFRCRDMTLESTLKAMLRVELPDAPEEILSFDPSDRGDRQMEAFRQLVTLLTLPSFETWPKSRDDRIADRRDQIHSRNDGIHDTAGREDPMRLLPLLIALLTDLAIMFCATAAPPRPPANRLGHWLDDDPHATLPDAASLEKMDGILDAQGAPGMETYRLVAAFRVRLSSLWHWSRRPTDYVWVPANPQTPQEEQLALVLDILETKKRATLVRTGMSLHQLAEATGDPWLQKLAAGGRVVCVYRLHRNAMGDLLRAAFAAS